MNPYPTENLGYDSKRKVEIVTNCSSGNRGIRKWVKLSQSNPPITVDSTFIEHDHSYFSYSAPSSSSSVYVEGDTSFQYQEVNNANDWGIFVKLLQVIGNAFARFHDQQQSTEFHLHFNNELSSQT